MQDNSLSLYKEIIEVIKEEAKTNEINQHAIGKHLGIKQSAVSSIITGKTKLTLEQFFKLCKILNLNPTEVMNRADAKTVDIETMSFKIERTIYKTPVHLLAYCASTKPTRIKELTKIGIKKEKAQKAFEDLLQAELIKENKGYYMQTKSNVTHRKTSTTISSDCHKKVLNHSWVLWQKNRKSKAFTQNRFNYYQLDRFSISQITEIETTLWRAYEKIRQYQKENMSNSYSNDEYMPLWNIHLMLTTPIEE